MVPIIKKTADFIVWDKPPGMVVNSAATVRGVSLMEYIRREGLVADQYCNQPSFWRRQGVVHRLDKDASGIILQARCPDLFLFWQNQFRRHRVIKKYWILVWGDISSEGEISFPLAKQSYSRRYPMRVDSGGKVAKTLFWRRRQWHWQGKTLSLVLVQTLTGRTHQVRAHFRYLGFPIWGDKIYGWHHHREQWLGDGRLFLHATFLKIALPNGKLLTATSPLPKALEAVILELDRNATSGKT